MCFIILDEAVTGLVGGRETRIDRGGINLQGIIIQTKKESGEKR
jgi:hypothetical protein